MIGPMNIAKIIREGRERLNLNQTQLAELVGVSPQAVQQWESGATLPRGKRLNRIAEVLQLPPSVMHFGQTLDAPQAMPEMNTLSGRSEAHRSRPRPGPEGVSGSRTAEEKPASETDALISQVVEAMRRMSKEDAARLVTISKALVSAASVQAEALQEDQEDQKDQEDREDLKPLPAPDLPAHPQPAFPPRRMPEGRAKVRGKTATR